MIDQSGLEAEMLPHTMRTTTEDIEDIDRDKSADGTMMKVLHHQSEDGSSDGEGSDLLPSHPPRLDQTNPAIDLIDDMSDDQFMVIADHMRLQKTVSSFVMVVINLRQETVPDDAEGDTPTVVSGTRATFDSSGYDQNAPRAPFEATADNPMPPKDSYWGMPGYSSPYPGPRAEDYGYSPQHGSYRRSQMPASSPLGFQRPVHDLEKIRLQEELAFLRSDRARKEEEEKNRQEEKVRQAAEDAIARRMEDEKRAKADIMREQEIKALKDAYDRFKAETNARKEAHDKEQAEAKAIKDADAAATAAKEAENRLVDEAWTKLAAVNPHSMVGAGAAGPGFRPMPDMGPKAVSAFREGRLLHPNVSGQSLGGDLSRHHF
ncbi:hypothetical protein CCHR01_10945 [Colletotrichum chrysophilum]|uniref:Uncharacterized protein n=1 Tax=Colletotrichum chrysophilum TaxID=1836956 RepID=A0AAD9AEQ3_9PEZI|nr:hypothetical protein CCHR01_10945 [Colletotrichum chrysophilum]